MNYASIISGIIYYVQHRSIFQLNTVLLASIIVELAESIVYSIHWHLSNIQNNHSSKNWYIDGCSGKFSIFSLVVLKHYSCMHIQFTTRGLVLGPRVKC